MSTKKNDSKTTSKLQARNSQLLSFVFPKHFSRQHSQSITRFIWHFIIDGNVMLILLISSFRFVCRFIELINFAIALKALVAAIRPDFVLKVFSYILAFAGLDMTITYESLPPILIGIVILVSLVNWLLVWIVSSLDKYFHNKLARRPYLWRLELPINDDLFVIEKLPGLSQNIIKCIDIMGFLIVMIWLVSLFSPGLVLFLMPILAMMIVVQIIVDRAKLQWLERMREAKLNYTTIVTEAGRGGKRTLAENNSQRQDYINIKEHLKYRKAMILSFNNFIGALALCGVIYYLFQSKLEMGALISVLILFVVAVRRTLVASKELSVQFISILDLRKDTKQLDRIFLLDKTFMKTTKLNKFGSA